MRTATVTFVIAAMFSITAVAQDLTSWFTFLHSLGQKQTFALKLALG
jgi:hypothetical protein